MLRHGVQREVFICHLATNALSILSKGKGRPKLASLLSAREVAALAVQRWIVPRSERRPEYRLWKESDVKALLGEQRKPLRLASSR
jgi:hypothetical protein